MRKEMSMEMREMAEGIRQVFEDAGWDAGAPIGKADAERLEMAVRGEAGRYTITAHRSVLVLDDPVFELCDSDSTRVAWVRKIPSPERAAALLDRYGLPAEEADTVDPATPPFPPVVPEEEER